MENRSLVILASGMLHDVHVIVSAGIHIHVGMAHSAREFYIVDDLYLIPFSFFFFVDVCKHAERYR